MSGTTTEMDIDESNRSASIITDGKIEGNLVSFYTQSELAAAFENEAPQPYKKMYWGTLNKNKDEIAFKRINDAPGGGKTEIFVAKRK